MLKRWPIRKVMGGVGNFQLGTKFCFSPTAFADQEDQEQCCTSKHFNFFRPAKTLHTRFEAAISTLFDIKANTAAFLW